MRRLSTIPDGDTPSKVRGKIVIMTTTNGTRALVAAQAAEEVFIGAFLNLSAVSRRLAESERDVIITCSGEKNLFCMKDVVCGGGIIARLNAEVNSLVTTDASRAAKILYEHFSSDICGMLEGSDWGQYLSGIGLNEDVRICARIDSSRLVPVYKEGKVVLDR